MFLIFHCDFDFNLSPQKFNARINIYNSKKKGKDGNGIISQTQQRTIRPFISGDNP